MTCSKTDFLSFQITARSYPRKRVAASSFLRVIKGFHTELRPLTQHPEVHWLRNRDPLIGASQLAHTSGVSAAVLFLWSRGQHILHL